MRFSWKNEEARICGLAGLQGLPCERLERKFLHELKPDDFFWDYFYNAFLFVSHYERQFNRIVCKIYDPDYDPHVKIVYYPLFVRSGNKYITNPDIIYKVIKPNKKTFLKHFENYGRIQNYGK